MCRLRPLELEGEILIDYSEMHFLIIVSEVRNYCLCVVTSIYIKPITICMCDG